MFLLYSVLCLLSGWQKSAGDSGKGRQCAEKKIRPFCKILYVIKVSFLLSETFCAMLINVLFSFPPLCQIFFPGKQVGSRTEIGKI